MQLAQQQQRSRTGAGDGIIGDGLHGGRPNLGGLRGLPRDHSSPTNFQNMIAQNPHYIPFLIQQLASARPELASRLASDPSSVLQILGGMEGEGDDGQGGELPPGVHAIHLTQDERAAITRVSPVTPSTLKGLIHFGLSSWRRTLGLRIKMQSRRIWRVTRMRNLLQIIFWTVISMIEAMSLVLPTPNEKAFSVRYASSKFIADRTVQFYMHLDIG